MPLRIGVLTGGGDCPGLNAAIRAIVRNALQKGDIVIGIRNGWQGLVENKFVPLGMDEVSGILATGGTILGTARINPFKVPNGIRKCLANFRAQRLSALISIGGEGTLKIASVFSKQGMPIVCVPKTIDNDTWGTDYTIGFDTAVQIATEAIDRLHTTAESHNRVMIVEVMGRHAGWIATYSGIAGGADAILIPEEPFDLEELCRIITRRAKRKRLFSIFVVSEDARIRIGGKRILKTPVRHDEYGDIQLGGISQVLARLLRRRTGAEVRVTVLGHIQRGGVPSAFDRVLATRLGVFAVDLIHKGHFGTMAVLQGNRIREIPIADADGLLKQVYPDLIGVARTFFG